MKRAERKITSADNSSEDTGADQVLLGGKFAQAVRFIFIPHKVNRDEPKLDAVRRLCTVGTSFEELILSWVQPQSTADWASSGLAAFPAESDRITVNEEPAVQGTVTNGSSGNGAVGTHPGFSITISRNDEMPFRSIGVIFERGELCFGIACVPVDQVVSLYGLHERLNESTFSLSDSEGFTCDQEWFEKRNIRLGIVEDKPRGCHIVPASSIGELVLEYSLSTAGFARFSAAEREDTPADEIEITLVFLGKDLTRGWHEEMAVGLGALERHVKGTRSADTPTLLI